MFPRYFHIRYVKSVNTESDLPRYGNTAGDVFSINDGNRQVVWSDESWEPYPQYYHEWCGQAFITACKDAEELTLDQKIEAIFYAFACIEPTSILRGVDWVRGKK